MNAREYSQQYKRRLTAGEKKDEIVADIHRQFLEEANTLTRASSVKNDIVLIGVLKKQDEKWRSLARMVSDIPSAGFVFGVFAVIPEIYEAAEVMNFLKNFKN